MVPDPVKNVIFSQRAVEGLRLYNQYHFFEAHEALEDAWRHEPGRLRTLYQGILQFGVGLYHLQRSNPVGAAKVFQRAWKLLQDWQFDALPYQLNLLVSRSQEMDKLIRLHPDQFCDLSVSSIFVPLALPD